MRPMGVVWCSVALILFVFVLRGKAEAVRIPTTLEGPFEPVTVPLDNSLLGQTIDLPDDDPRVQKRVTGISPEQISLALSTPDVVWVSWVTGDFQIGSNVQPLDPESVASVVNYGTS